MVAKFAQEVSFSIGCADRAGTKGNEHSEMWSEARRVGADYAHPVGSLGVQYARGIYADTEEGVPPEESRV